MDIIVTSIISLIITFFATNSFTKNFFKQNVIKPEAKIVKIAPDSSPVVLGDVTTNTTVDSSAVDSVLFDIDAIFNKPVTIQSGLRVDGQSVFSKGIKGVSLDLGSGTVTAGNVVYSITQGSGITVSGGQTPTISNAGVLSIGGQTGAITFAAGGGISISGLTISNDDPGTAQEIFKTISVLGQEDITAGSNTDILTFASGHGITLTTDPTTKTLTIDNSSDPSLTTGWT